VILFARNVSSEKQLRGLVADVRRELPSSFLCIDQEGGSVDRFRALTGPSPAFAAAAQAGKAGLAGALAGEVCAAFGIEWDLAPVVDLSLEGAGRSVLRGRAAAGDPSAVADAAARFLEGLASHGVAGCLKHFPGLGRATVDSHLVLPALPGSERELARDLLPFRDLAKTVPAVMIAHADVGGRERPASLDRTIATALLRDDVGFRGIAVSDDLEMGALAAFGDLPSRAAAAFEAGCDLLCIGKETSALPDSASAVEALDFAERAREADARLVRFHRSLGDLRGRPRAAPRPLEEIAAAYRKAVELLG